MASQDKQDRRARAAQIRDAQQSSEKRRNRAIIGVCVLVGVLIIGAAAYKPVKDALDLRKFNDVDLAKIGAAATVCQEPTTKEATGNQDHVDVGTPMTYPDAPPAFGQHWSTWDGMEKKFYSSADRPELGLLVHNLEHGYTIMWYDESIADDSAAMDEVKAIAKKFTGTDNFRMKFKAVPWTSEDGKAFPDGQHVAFTHWSIGGAGEDLDNQVGVTQYCSEVSGAALKTFMSDYPYMDSPEPLGG